MTENDFEDLLDRRGADLASWPEQAAAEALLARSGAARAMLKQAQELATLLDDAFLAVAPVGLKTRILAEAKTRILAEARARAGRIW